MTVEILRERLRQARPSSAEAEQHLLREMMQEITLAALARARFFAQGAFHGGSSLRILHGLRRFSEDLDFVLRRPSRRFAWARFESCLTEEFALYGADLEIRDREDTKTVKSVFLKDESLGKILQLRHGWRPGRKIAIKLEIDTSPPAGSVFETRYVDFPVPFSLLTQDLGSSFASKLHALLCRPYVKGRDWFDFLWYVRRPTAPRWKLLASALAQQGPWQGQRLDIGADWLVRQLVLKVQSIDWRAAAGDVERFLSVEVERRGLNAWSAELFLATIERFRRDLSTTER